MKRVLFNLALVLLLAYLAASFFIVRGATSAERKPQELLPPSLALSYEDVSFTPRGSGLRLEGWFLPGATGGPAVIFVHGLGSVRSGDDALAVSRRLVDAGYNVLLFDLRAHGSSDGDKVSAGYFEREDVLGAYDYLVSRGFAPGRIGLHGFSLGAATAIMAAARERGMAAVVADSPFAKATDLIVQETARKTPVPADLVPIFLPGARLLADQLHGIDLGDLRPERDVTRLAYPVLVIHGDADTRIPIEQGQRVASAAPAGSELWIVPGADHTDAYKVAPDEYVRRVLAYFDARLR